MICLKNSIFLTAFAVCCLVFCALTAATCVHLNGLAQETAAEVKQSKTIVIDAGHGGEDGGASGKSGTPEKDINLAVSKDIQSLLTAFGYRVVMTRTEDVSLSDPLDTIHERKISDLHNRLKLVQSEQSCIFVSIHQNHFEQTQYNGTQVFYSANTPEGKILAESVREQVTNLLQKENKREIKPATNSIYLLWNAKVPAILVECGFLSNAQEEQELKDENYQHKLAFAICCGIENYLGTAG